jgi:hypothetical protein
VSLHWLLRVRLGSKLKGGAEMWPGCIAIGQIKCDGCHRAIEYGERYLVINGEEGKKERLCVDCCLSRGYASYRMGKEEQPITFFSKG